MDFKQLYYEESTGNIIDEDGNNILEPFKFCPPWVYLIFYKLKENYTYIDFLNNIVYELIYPEEESNYYKDLGEEFIENWC